ncbi:MAG: SRPBCC family protein [Actinobacteria bacterium]|nr:SRPBCC family protein [Actinomycetota bacterium]
MPTHESVSESIELSVSAATAYDALSSPARMAHWSPELQEVRSAPGQSLVVGDEFGGSSKNGWHRWRTLSTVRVANPPTDFAFDVAAAGQMIARWSFHIVATESGCRVTQTWTDQRQGPLGVAMRAIGLVASGVWDRASHNSDGMRQTLEAMKADLEASHR